MMDIAFAPALPNRNASQSMFSATKIAAYGARLRDVTSRGFAPSFGGYTGAGSVENTVLILGSDTAPAVNAWSSHKAI